MFRQTPPSLLLRTWCVNKMAIAGECIEENFHRISIVWWMHYWQHPWWYLRNCVTIDFNCRYNVNLTSIAMLAVTWSLTRSILKFYSTTEDKYCSIIVFHVNLQEFCEISNDFPKITKFQLAICFAQQIRKSYVSKPKFNKPIVCLFIYFSVFLTTTKY